jgi:hypothetical protein
MGHYNLVVEFVEEGGDIRINHMSETILPVFNRGCNGVMGFAARPESETARRETRFEDGGEYLIYRLLAHAIHYCRDS